MDRFEQLKEKYKDEWEKRYEQDERFRKLVDLMDEYLENSVGTKGAPQRDLDDAVTAALVRYHRRHGWTDPHQVQ